MKTLEEPPPYAVFILATTEKHKVIPTILSRCQIFDFNRIQISDMVRHLRKIAQQEGVEAEEEALNLIAQKADGALRDALSIFDLIVTFSTERKITYQTTIENLHILDYDYYFRVTDALLTQNLPQVMLTFDDILRQGFDGHNFIVGPKRALSQSAGLQRCAETIRLLPVSDRGAAALPAAGRRSPLVVFAYRPEPVGRLRLAVQEQQEPAPARGAGAHEDGLYPGGGEPSPGGASSCSPCRSREKKS